ncbi:hypothetical protein K3728_02660 [Rhodobacteraceae bacterium M385]|nr:hypothetical protein K3728_02660 [Rhodobacteraceae bacterium M385]
MRAAPLGGGAASGLFDSAAPLLDPQSGALITPAEGGGAPSPSGSLFAGTGTGYFAPLPPRVRENARAGSPLRVLPGRTPAARLLSLIATVEAGRAGYDAVQHGARVHPPTVPTQMTLADIYAWIAATPGQPHAIGRYQFIPPTLRRVAQIRGYGPQTPFSPAVQDSLALVLLEDAGLRAFEGGTMGRVQFMENLARIWAGLPLPNGRSFYEGYAGNSAAMTWAEFEDGVGEIWPLG